MLLCKYWARDPMSSCPGPLTHLYEALNLAEWMRRRKVADLPGFGWHMAQALEERSQPCPLLERPAYKWVGNALTFLQATGQIPADNSELWAVSEADGLFRKGTRRVLLQATLLADDATIDAAAAAGAAGCDDAGFRRWGRRQSVRLRSQAQSNLHRLPHRCGQAIRGGGPCRMLRRPAVSVQTGGPRRAAGMSRRPLRRQQAARVRCLPTNHHGTLTHRGGPWFRALPLWMAEHPAEGVWPPISNLPYLTMLPVWFKREIRF